MVGDGRGRREGSRCEAATARQPEAYSLSIEGLPRRRQRSGSGPYQRPRRRVSEAPPARPRPGPLDGLAGASGSRARCRAASRSCSPPTPSRPASGAEQPRSSRAHGAGRRAQVRNHRSLSFSRSGKHPKSRGPTKSAPAPEHGRDLHARPAAHRLVQLARGARPSALEAPPGLATRPRPRTRPGAPGSAVLRPGSFPAVTSQLPGLGPPRADATGLPTCAPPSGEVISADVEMDAVRGRGLHRDLAGPHQGGHTGARSSRSISGSMSRATMDRATMPSKPPTSVAGTIRSVPPPDHPSMARGPPLTSTSGSSKSPRKVAAVSWGDRQPMTIRLNRTGDSTAASANAEVASSTSTPWQARGCRKAMRPASPSRDATSRRGTRWRRSAAKS